jgi:hypothetical protein
MVYLWERRKHNPSNFGDWEIDEEIRDCLVCVFGGE